MSYYKNIRARLGQVKVVLPLIMYVLFLLFPSSTLSFGQRINLGALILTVVWWATGWVKRTPAALFLLIIFMVFGQTPLKQVLSFPLSQNFILVVCAFLLSQGIVKSGVANRIAVKIIARFGRTPLKLLMLSFGLAAILIFFIPHPFPRVIILAAIYQPFLNKQQLNARQKGVLFFSIFVAATCTPLIFLNGDMMLNYVAIGCANMTVSWMEWAR